MIEYEDGYWTPTHVFINTKASGENFDSYRYKSLIWSLDFDVLIIDASLTELRKSKDLGFRVSKLRMIGEWNGYWHNTENRFYIYHHLSKKEADAEESKKPSPFKFDIASFLEEEKLKPIRVFNQSGSS